MTMRCKPAFLSAVCAAVALVGGATLLPSAAFAQTATSGSTMKLPTNVLLFPPVLPGTTPTENGEVNRAAVDAQEIITEAIKRKMVDAGVGAFVYSRRLPSVQRALNESTIKADAAAGPGDDDRLAMRLADIAGATEYIVIAVDDYKFDAASRTATFTLSLIRKATLDGAQLGTVAEKATGGAPEDVAQPRQEGSAVARAADVVAEQTVAALFPMPKVANKKK